jgi:hypothetical protein
MVDNEALRERVLYAVRWTEGLTLYEVARRAGYMRKPGRRADRETANVQWADPTPMLRALGLRPTTTVKKGVRYSGTQRRCNYEAAVRIAAAVGADPFEVGL